MQTIVGISLSPVYILPLMFTFSIIGRTLLFRVRYFLSDTGHLWYKTHPAVLSGIWLYSIAVALIILSSSPLLYRIHAVLILSFILQMAVTDALTGLLPGTFTRRFFKLQECYHKSRLIYGGSVQQNLPLLQLSYSAFIN